MAAPAPRRTAAAPVLAHKRVGSPMSANSFASLFIMNDLPHPGPPVSTCFPWGSEQIFCKTVDCSIVKASGCTSGKVDDSPVGRCASTLEFIGACNAHVESAASTSMGSLRPHEVARFVCVRVRGVCVRARSQAGVIVLCAPRRQPQGYPPCFPAVHCGHCNPAECGVHLADKPGCLTLLYISGSPILTSCRRMTAHWLVTTGLFLDVLHVQKQESKKQTTIFPALIASRGVKAGYAACALGHQLQVSRLTHPINSPPRYRLCVVSSRGCQLPA